MATPPSSQNPLYQRMKDVELSLRSLETYIATLNDSTLTSKANFHHAKLNNLLNYTYDAQIHTYDPTLFSGGVSKP